MSGRLFEESLPEPSSNLPESADLETRKRQFVNRWCMSWNREHAAKELDELIAVAKEQGR